MTACRQTLDDIREFFALLFTEEHVFIMRFVFIALGWYTNGWYTNGELSLEIIDMKFC